MKLESSSPYMDLGSQLMHVQLKKVPIVSLWFTGNNPCSDKFASSTNFSFDFVLKEVHGLVGSSDARK